LIANIQYCSRKTTSTPPSCVNVAALWEDAALFAQIFPSEVTTPMTQSSLWQPSDIMSAEAGTEPEAPKRRGRIPQSAWPHILERHRAGATLSAIAREFDCTPSAISYIVRKAEASGIEPAAAPAAEPAESSETVTESVAESAEPAQPVEQQDQPETASSAAEPAVEDSTASSHAQPAVEQPAVVEQAPEPRPVPKRPAPQEGRPQLRASDLGRGSAQAAAREPVPAPAAPVEARPAPSAQAPSNAVEAARPATPPTGRQEPAPPVDAVEGRLRDTARSCLVAYRGWKSAPGENSIQTLHDAVHELRKALARIEIDMSASRRDEQVNRPIPIPAHRAARRPR
jgi:transposase-like protein